MGHPKKQRKKFEAPKKPWDKSRIEKERGLLKTYGLRRKKEVWRAESILRGLRRRARELQARRNEEREKILLNKITDLGIPCRDLDDVLEIRVEDLLSRRLQSLVHKTGLANTARQARQFIVHGKISVNKKRIRWPSYVVKKAEEESISIDEKMTKSIEKGDNE